MRYGLWIIAAAVTPLLGGCLAKAAVDVVTAPVRAAGQVADWATTSQDESDRALGRKLRAREAEIGRLERRRVRLASDCDDGEREACEQAEQLGDEIADLREAPL